jgi:hypothetical protein
MEPALASKILLPVAVLPGPPQTPVRWKSICFLNSTRELEETLFVKQLTPFFDPSRIGF